MGMTTDTSHDRNHRYQASTFMHEHSQEYLGKVITFASAVGGEGKTTTALAYARQLMNMSNLSVRRGLAARPLRVVVVDMDYISGSVGVKVGIDTRGGKSDLANTLGLRLAMNHANMSEDLLREFLIYEHKLDAHVLLAPVLDYNSENEVHRQHISMLNAEFHVEILNTLRRMFDVIIVDTTTNKDDPLLHVAYCEADILLVVSSLSRRANFLRLEEWTDWVTNTHFTGLGVDPAKIGLIHNHYSERLAGQYSDDVERFLDTRLMMISRILNNRDAYETTRLHKSMNALVEEDVDAYTKIVYDTLGREFPFVMNYPTTTPNKGLSHE